MAAPGAWPLMRMRTLIMGEVRNGCVYPLTKFLVTSSTRMEVTSNLPLSVYLTSGIMLRLVVTTMPHV